MLFFLPPYSLFSSHFKSKIWQFSFLCKYCSWLFSLDEASVFNCVNSTNVQQLASVVPALFWILISTEYMRKSSLTFLLKLVGMHTQHSHYIKTVKKQVISKFRMHHRALMFCHCGLVWLFTFAWNSHILIIKLFSILLMHEYLQIKTKISAISWLSLMHSY